ncbi:unnamed protein product [Effrenium voratum]|uniref:Pentatricopeptide repeat-containing protein, chloroplastic n=1 Tax=Effrenium voratum TaxID=2562239 RepID=A0AA36IP75_9DINO|nr:unnamed protein product [Effrenium voratum]CAJ1458660.1 unnamed protein product [Effrenium voratum]
MALVSWNAAISACRRRADWEAALALLRAVRQPDIVSFTAAASACEAARQWQHAVALLSRPKLDAAACSALVSCWGRAGKWHHALEALRPGGFAVRWRFHLVVRGAAIAAVARARRWREALLLLQEAADARHEQDEVGYAAAMHGCTSRWQVALQLLAEMPQRRLQWNQVVLNTAISACEAGHRWQLAVALFSRVRPRADSLNAAMAACERGHQWQQALALLETSWARVSPSSLTMVVILAACATGSLWQAALSWVFRAWKDHSCPDTDTTCLNAALSACARAARWEQASALLSCPVRKDFVSYATALEAFKTRGSRTLQLLQDASANRVDLNARAEGLAEYRKHRRVTASEAEPDLAATREAAQLSHLAFRAAQGR